MGAGAGHAGIVSGLKVTFLGSGDAFGSGGRLQTCIQVEGTDTTFLLDCGASALVSMRRFGADPNAVDVILLSHLHGDHFAGVPFFILDAQLISKRRRPLVVAGPPGTRVRLHQAMDVLFPGMRSVQQRFDIDVVELDAGARQLLGPAGDIAVTAYRVRHAPGTEPHALRVEHSDRILCFTGDTEWCDALIPAASNVDLLIAEAYFFDKRVPYHLDLVTLQSHLGRLAPKRVVLTHMASDMLARSPALQLECAADGMVIDL